MSRMRPTDLCNCAERTALFAAIAAGCKRGRFHTSRRHRQHRRHPLLPAAPAARSCFELGGPQADRHPGQPARPNRHRRLPRDLLPGAFRLRRNASADAPRPRMSLSNVGASEHARYDNAPRPCVIRAQLVTANCAATGVDLTRPGAIAARAMPPVGAGQPRLSLNSCRANRDCHEVRIWMTAVMYNGRGMQHACATMSKCCNRREICFHVHDGHYVVLAYFALSGSA